MEKPILSHLWSLKNKAEVFNNQHHAETPASPLPLSSELFYCTRRQVFDELDLDLSSLDQKSVPLSVICVTWFLKSKVDFHCTSLTYKRWYLLAQVMALLHSFSWGILKGKCYFHTVSCVLYEYMVKFTVLF